MVLQGVRIWRQGKSGVKVNQKKGESMGKQGVEAQDCVPMLRAIADETRWCLIQLLLEDSMTVSELVHRSGISQPNVSKHLGVLREAGIVVSERNGKEVRTTLAQEFRSKVKSGKAGLDLGCCDFRFESKSCC
jgi:predicted transcriptional regulator